MDLAVTGINHSTANISLRERVAFPPAIVTDALRQAIGLPEVNEAVIVSTCNRTEVYLGFSGPGPEPDPEADEGAGRHRLTLEWLAGFHDMNADELASCSYFHEGGEAVRHLMRVAAGLDSMVLGEPQILGQIKSAYALSRDLKLAGGNLARAFETAFSVAKEVRTETAIGASPVSVAYAAVTLAGRIFSDLSRLQVLLVGAGRTIELAARHLTEKGVRGIVVANRTLDNALQLAGRISGEGALLSDLPELLFDADIVISSTSSQLPLIGKGVVERAIRRRKHRPMLLVDLAVPRDIEVEVSEIPDAYLYGIDDIGSVIEDGVNSRREAAVQAGSLIDLGMEKFLGQLRSRNAVATLRRLRGKADAIREAELNQARRELEKGGDAGTVLEALARAITNKLIHAPSVRMKQASAEGRDELLRVTQELFELDEDAPRAPEQDPGSEPELRKKKP